MDITPSALDDKDKMSQQTALDSTEKPTFENKVQDAHSDQADSESEGDEFHDARFPPEEEAVRYS